MNKLEIISPGEILKEEFLDPLSLGINEFSKKIKVHPSRISNIINKKRAITAEIALRLNIAFGTTADFWLNLQKNYELRQKLIL